MWGTLLRGPSCAADGAPRQGRTERERVAGPSCILDAGNSCVRLIAKKLGETLFFRTKSRTTLSANEVRDRFLRDQLPACACARRHVFIRRRFNCAALVDAC